MLNSIFQGLFDTSFTTVISPGTFLLCLASSLVLGSVFCAMVSWHSDSSPSFGMTLRLLPAAVCVVIMAVNGNVGTGVAVAGAFSLVRFRSVPGTGREISAIFIAMTCGLLLGMGYIAYAALFTLILGGVMMAYTFPKKQPAYRQLRITIPENLDYAGIFDPILDQYTSNYTLKQVKTTNMGSLFRLTYDLTVLDSAKEKEMLDALRCCNGNLELSLSYQEERNPAL